MTGTGRSGSRSREPEMLLALCGLKTPEWLHRNPESRLAWEVVMQSLRDLYDPEKPPIVRFDAWMFFVKDEIWMDFLDISLSAVFRKFPFQPFVVSLKEVMEWEKRLSATIKNANGTERTGR